MPQASVSKKPVGQREYMVMAGIVAVLVALWFGYSAMTPSEEERDTANLLVQFKSEGDQARDRGDIPTAYERYTKVFTLSAGKTFKSSGVKKAIADAIKARDQLRQSNAAVLAKAKLIK